MMIKKYERKTNIVGEWFWTIPLVFASDCLECSCESPTHIHTHIQEREREDEHTREREREREDNVTMSERVCVCARRRVKERERKSKKERVRGWVCMKERVRVRERETSRYVSQASSRLNVRRNCSLWCCLCWESEITSERRSLALAKPKWKTDQAKRTASTR